MKDVGDITFKPVKKPKQWTPSLSVEEERLLLSGSCLNDLLVNAAQHPLQAAHPHVKGLQDVFLGRILAFDIIRGDFVQILAYWCCTQGMHCIHVSTIGCGDVEVDVFDSMGPGLTRTLERQIASIL